MYHIDMTFTLYTYYSEEVNNSRNTAEINLGHALAHRLQLEMLRSHLRLSVQDLMDPVTVQRLCRVFPIYCLLTVVIFFCSE